MVDIFLYMVFLIQIAGGRNAMKLRKVDVPIVPNEQCKQWLKEGKKALVVTENSICAGYEEGKKDSCNVSQLIYQDFYRISVTLLRIIEDN